MTAAEHTPRQRPGTTRRSFLLAGAAAGVTGVAAIATDRAGALLASHSQPSVPLNGDRSIPFYGEHQAGVTSSPGAHATYLSLTMLSTTTPEDLRKWLRLLTDDAARLTAGARPLADLEPELAERPAGLTVTFGFGEALVALAGAAAPPWLHPLPSFAIDALDSSYCGADLLLLLHGDDPSVIAHASRMLLRDSRSFATLAWRQTGFRRAYGTDPSGTTMRNLFGQLDGSSNPKPGTEAFEAAVWADDPTWLAGGTSLVLRRIQMDMEGWEQVGRVDRGGVVGRHIDSGAPLTGGSEHDTPDFTAKTPVGFPVINDVSHVARAHIADPRSRIVRIAYSYDDAVEAHNPGSEEQISNAGLLFGSWQANVDKQYVPIQRRLAEADLLNTWTTPVGSVVVAIPPGCARGGFIGEGLFA